MFQFRACAFVVAGLLSAVPAFADSPFVGKKGPLAFTINSDKSEFKFVSDMPAERIPGNAKGITGSLAVGDAEKAETTTGTVTVPVAKMETGNPMRDQHMRGPEWLNGGANPNISFAIDKIDNVRDIKAAADKGTAKATAHGTFTMNGVGKKLSIPVDLAYLATGNLKVTAKFKVSLKDHNIKGKGNSVGDKVGENIDIDATLYATAK